MLQQIDENIDRAAAVEATGKKQDRVDLDVGQSERIK
jgi:hypothetical protein